MDVTLRIINTLSVPLVALNWVAPVVAIIWLAILGEWFLLGCGISLWTLGAPILGLAMIPGTLLFTAIGSSFTKHQRAAKSIAFLATVSSFAVLSLWCLLNLWFLLDNATASSIIPILLWFYTIATNPIGYLMNKEIQAGEIYPLIATFFVKFGSLVTIIAILLFQFTFLHAAILFALSMLLGLLLELKTALDNDARARYSNSFPQ